jgi:hypothetical protein
MQSRNGEESPLVYLSHARSLLPTILFVILKDAERIDPQITKSKLSNQRDNISKGLWQFANGMRRSWLGRLALVVLSGSRPPQQ